MLRLPQRRRQSGEFVDGQRLAAACRVDARRVEHFIGHHALECGMQRFATLAEGRVDQLERQLAQLGVARARMRLDTGERGQGRIHVRRWPEYVTPDVAHEPYHASFTLGAP